MQKKKWVVRLLLVLAVAVFAAGAAWAGWQAGSRYAAKQVMADYERSSTYRRVLDGWTATLADQYADVVFFGDSLTAGGSWGEYYVDEMVSNLGVVGDTTDQLLLRVHQPELLMPEKCFVMIGVNDLSYGSTPEEVLPKYDRLVCQLCEMPMDVYVQSVLPVREGEIVYDVRNAEIRQLNEGIAEIAERYGVPYIDVHSAFADEQGMLDADVSFDGLHINEAGYERWQQILRPYVEE